MQKIMLEFSSVTPDVSSSLSLYVYDLNYSRVYVWEFKKFLKRLADRFT